MFEYQFTAIVLRKNGRRNAYSKWQNIYCPNKL